MGLSLKDFAAYVIEKFFDFLLSLINGALKPFLDLVKKFMSEPVKLSVFVESWAIIVYILSMFYGLLLVFIGLRLIVSGESAEQREKSKRSLRNTIIMMILIQGSYHLYSVIIDISAALTKTMLNLTGSSFFKITLSSYSSFGFELVLSVIYLIVLLITLLLLVFRYIFVSSGVLFFVIGIFMYFIGPLNQYGRLIVNCLLTLIFLPFFYSIIFLSSSKLLNIDSLINYKTLIMIGAFTLVILITCIMVLFVIVKAALKVAGPVGQVAKVVGYVS